MKALMRKALLPVLLLSLGIAAGAQPPAQQGGRGTFGGMQRVGGTITAVSGDTISVKGEDGAAYQVSTTANTRVMKSQGQGQGGGPVKVTDLKPGDGVMAAGNMDDAKKTLHAMFVVATDAETLKKMRDNLGKTYIAGRVTAIDADNLKMTVKRADGVEQVIGFDETTSFKRGRGRMMMGGAQGGSFGAGMQAPAGGPEPESITLADIKVGDNVTGQGSLKSGTFVPTQLIVATPRGPREGRPGRGENTAPPQ